MKHKESKLNNNYISLSNSRMIRTLQTLVAIGEVTKEINRGSRDFHSIKSSDYGRFLVLSLGTGSTKVEGKYSAMEAARWGVFGWLTSDHSTPLVDAFTQASADMVDVHISVVCKALNSENNYLRIQVINLPCPMCTDSKYYTIQKFIFRTDDNTIYIGMRNCRMIH